MKFKYLKQINVITFLTENCLTRKSTVDIYGCLFSPKLRLLTKFKQISADVWLFCVRTADEHSKHVWLENNSVQENQQKYITFVMVHQRGVDITKLANTCSKPAIKLLGEITITEFHKSRGQAKVKAAKNTLSGYLKSIYITQRWESEYCLVL